MKEASIGEDLQISDKIDGPQKDDHKYQLQDYQFENEGYENCPPDQKPTNSHTFSPPEQPSKDIDFLQIDFKNIQKRENTAISERDKFEDLEEEKVMG